jgi:hypothetical protein
MCGWGIELPVCLWSNRVRGKCSLNSCKRLAFGLAVFISTAGKPHGHPPRALSRPPPRPGHLFKLKADARSVRATARHMVRADAA